MEKKSEASALVGEALARCARFGRLELIEVIIRLSGDRSFEFAVLRIVIDTGVGEVGADSTRDPVSAQTAGRPESPKQFGDGPKRMDVMQWRPR